MPIYEFRCNDCGSNFEDLVRKEEDFQSVICPVCGSGTTSKQISSFAARIAGAGNSAPASRSNSQSCSSVGT